MSGRDFGRGGRGGFGEREGRGGGFRDREGGNFRDRERGGRDSGPPPSRPWERRDDDERPARPSGDRPFERPERERDVRVERYDETPSRPPREDRPGDRPARFGGDRSGAARPDTFPPRTPERPAPTPRAEEPKTPAVAATARPTPAGWSQAHLLDSWNDEARLKGWTPTAQDLQEMVEDNIEADPQVPGRDRRAIGVAASGGVVTLTGTVRSRAVKFAAGSDAYWTFGVSDVKNELDVRPRGPQSGGETAPTGGKAKRQAKARTAAASGTASASNPEEVASPENAATATAAQAAAPAPSDETPDPAEEMGVTPEELGVTPEELAVPENAAATAMIDEGDEADEADEQ